MNFLVTGLVVVGMVLLLGLLAYLWLSPAASKARSRPPQPDPMAADQSAGGSAAIRNWCLTMLGPDGRFVENRTGTLDGEVDYVIEADGTQCVEFCNDDFFLGDGHAELRGLKGKTVEVDLPLNDGARCHFVGKVVGVDLDAGCVEVSQ